MGWTIGIPSLKLSTTKNKSKHCGNFYNVAAEALKERIGRDPDINPELSSANIYYGFTTAKELVNYSESHCATLKDAKGRALRSDAVKMCVTLIKPPAAFMATLVREEQIQFLNDGITKLKQIVGEDNVKSVAIHFDEQGPHAHVFWEPMTKDGRLCSKEVHNLQFFGRLNKEMPQHLRACGWDIDDCNVYDQALQNISNEQEKAESRQKNGRSSASFKAEAEQKLSDINFQIGSTINNLEQHINSHVRESVESVINETGGVYENVLFLMYQCDDARFQELNQEGIKLKEKLYGQKFKEANVTSGVRSLVEQIRDASPEQISWETRTNLWRQYREMSDMFWAVRGDLGKKLNKDLQKRYDDLDAIRESYYTALGFLHETRNIISFLIVLIWLCATAIREDLAQEKLDAVKKERMRLIRDTASFKRYCAIYREELKKGQLPMERYLSSMESIIKRLDAEYARICEVSPSRVLERENKRNNMRF